MGDPVSYLSVKTAFGFLEFLEKTIQPASLSSSEKHLCGVLHATWWGIKQQQLKA